MASAAPTVPEARSRKRAYATTPPVVGLGTLRRLLALEPGGGAVLSVYLPLEESALAPCEAELPLLVGQPAPTLTLCMVSRVRETLRALPGFAHGTRAVVLFFAGDGSELELVPLPERVAARAVFDTRPWLEPLIGMCNPGDRDAPLPSPRPRSLDRPVHVLPHAVSGDRVEAIACP
jgi:hypothetical protein